MHKLAITIFVLGIYSRSLQTSLSCLRRCNDNLDPNFLSYAKQDTVCGNNGVLYESGCHLSNAQCFDNKLEVIPNDLCKGKKTKCCPVLIDFAVFLLLYFFNYIFFLL